MSETEMRSRREIFFENYRKTKNIEAKTMLEMTSRDIIPAVSSYVGKLAQTLNAKRLALPNIDVSPEAQIIEKLSALLGKVYSAYTELETAENNAVKRANDEDASFYYKNTVNPKMDKLRRAVDACEVLTAREDWPMPTYGDIMFGV